MSRRCAGILLVAALAASGAACSSDAGAGDGDATTTSTTAPVAGDPSAGPGTTGVGGASPDPSVPIVDPASVEAFCALDRQLDQLIDEQLGDVDVADREAFRQRMATFVDDNAAVIDQYVAAAPPEIRDDVNASMDQTRAAVADAELFGALMAGTGDMRAPNRASAFIEANCPA